MKKLTFEQGYVCACAGLIRDFDQPNMAQELLRALGDFDLSSIGEYDLEVLKKHNLVPNKKRQYDKNKCHTSEFHCTYPECGCKP